MSALDVFGTRVGGGRCDRTLPWWKIKSDKKEGEICDD